MMVKRFIFVASRNIKSTCTISFSSSASLPGSNALTQVDRSNRLVQAEDVKFKLPVRDSEEANLRSPLNATFVGTFPSETSVIYGVELHLG